MSVRVREELARPTRAASLHVGAYDAKTFVGNGATRLDHVLATGKLACTVEPTPVSMQTDVALDWPTTTLYNKATAAMRSVAFEANVTVGTDASGPVRRAYVEISNRKHGRGTAGSGLGSHESPVDGVKYDAEYIRVWEPVGHVPESAGGIHESKPIPITVLNPQRHPIAEITYETPASTVRFEDAMSCNTCFKSSGENGTMRVEFNSTTKKAVRAGLAVAASSPYNWWVPYIRFD